MTRSEASAFLGIDPQSFDRYFRQVGLPCFMIGKRERYLKTELVKFVQNNQVT